MAESNSGVTTLLGRIRQGDRSAQDELFNGIELPMRALARRLMAGLGPDHTLQPTALVNEAVAQLLTGQKFAQVANRAQLFALFGKVMRDVLVDHARRRGAEKRGGQRERVPLSAALRVPDNHPSLDLVDLADAIAELSRQHQRAASVVDLHVLVGYTLREIADLLQVSMSTVESDWRLARAWLHEQLLPE